uniref:Resolvase n=97 Tax=Pseudomonadota TaxID=1224 RepID=A0A6C0NDI8_9ENTR|nr:resolvase [Enterobacter hormaechei subsp. xiangfangensis]
MGHRAAIYCRVSTADQSCERQEFDLRAFAGRAGYDVVGIFKETGSGTKLDRAERKKVLALAQSRQIDAILVTELSRWGRSTLDLLNTLRELENWKVSVIAMNGMAFDLSSPYGRMLATFLSGIAEFERDLISERVKSGLAVAKARGKRLGRQAGVRPKSDRLLPKVVAMRAEGRSYRWIARELGISKNTVADIVQRHRANRIRDLPSKRLYVFNPDTTPRELRKLVGGKAREDLIVANWPDIFRCAATMTAGKIRPSQLLRKLASYPRQNNLAVALREVGRIERTLFIIEWILDTDMQRRAQIGLNKGEAHHALKNALRIGRQGEIRDRTTEGQHYRIAGLNLLTAVIIYWNTVHLGHAVTERRNEGLDVPPEFLPHISPLGWAHILLTGEYLWPKEPKA